MKKISGNIIFTLKCLLLVVHPTINFQVHISNYLFCRSPSGSQVVRGRARDLGELPPRCRSLLQLAKHYFMWKFQLIISLTFKMILSKSKYILFLQKLPPPSFPFLWWTKREGRGIVFDISLHFHPFPSYEPSFFLFFLTSWCLAEPSLTLGLWP